MTDNPEGAGTVMNTPDLIDSKACNLKPVLSQLRQSEGSFFVSGRI